jgi:hypothetical protein
VIEAGEGELGAGLRTIRKNLQQSIKPAELSQEHHRDELTPTKTPPSLAELCKNQLKGIFTNLCEDLVVGWGYDRIGLDSD